MFSRYHLIFLMSQALSYVQSISYLMFLLCKISSTFLLHVLQVAAYDTVEKKMAFFDPSRAKDFLFISGTKVGDLISGAFEWIVQKTLVSLYSSWNLQNMFC